MNSRSQHNAKPPRVALIGGGVHAVVVADCMTAAGQAQPIGYVDHRDHNRAPMKSMGIAYLGDDEQLVRLVDEASVTACILGLAGLEHSHRRIALVASLDAQLPTWWTAVHPSATVADSVEIGHGTVVFAGVIINALARVGCHTVINTSAVIEHHCTIQDFAVISPRATLCGCVTVGRGAFVGAGAVVITDRVIGAGSVVGAGAVVLDDVPAHRTVVGNPARMIDRPTGLTVGEMAMTAI